MPGAFPPEPSNRPHSSRSSSEHDLSTSREERVEFRPPRRSRSFRRWARQKLLHRSSPGTNAGWHDDSGYDSWSSSSSSGCERVLFEHPTHGKPGLCIRDTDDYLTVQNPNPHTGEMSPSVLSLVSERTEPPPCIHDPAEALRTTLDRQQSQQKERLLRWRLFGKELPPTPPEHDQPPLRPPKVTVEDEEPPDALDSAIQPLQSQPPFDHYAAFDPDHLRMPGALTITPPVKTVTNGGTDTISTWVTEESRRVFELPAGPLTPGNTPPSQGFVPAGPRIMRAQPRSRSQVPAPARARSYTSYDPREAFCAQSRERVLGPRQPWERSANTAIPRRVCSIPRKPLADGYMAMPPPPPHGPDDIVRPPSSARSLIEADYPPPPPPPPHRYEAGRPYHQGEWNASSRPLLDTPPHSTLSVPVVPLTAPIPVTPMQNPPPSEPAPAIHHRATQTRASVAGAFKRHPIQPSFETPSVRAQTRLNGTGVQRLVITTGKPRQTGSNQGPTATATAGTQTPAPSGTVDKAQRITTSTRSPPRPQAAESAAEEMKRSTPTATTPSPAKQPISTTTKSTRKKLTKPFPASKASAAKAPTAERSIPEATPAPDLKPSPVRVRAPPAAPMVTIKAATSTAAARKTSTAPAAVNNASFAAQRAAALAALREQHAHHCGVSKHTTAKIAQTAAKTATGLVEGPEERVELASPKEKDAPLIAVRVSRQTAVRLLQALALIWAVVAGWHMLSVVWKGLVVVLWPVWWMFRVIAMVGGCVRGGGWAG